MQKLAIFWFRRDLRLQDNAGLYRALKSGQSVLALFIFDQSILDKLEEKNDARVSFIHQEILRLKSELQALGSDLLVEYGEPENIWEKLLKRFSIEAVYSNRDYEPYAKGRDKTIAALCNKAGIEFLQYKDQVIFDQDEVLKGDGTPYVVFTPYSRIWKVKLQERISISSETGKQISFYLKSYPTEKYFSNFVENIQSNVPSLEAMGFSESDIKIPTRTVKQGLIRKYEAQRNFPAIEGTSRLGIHFRFGTISIREKARSSRKLSETFLNELIWRDFYSMVLDHFPDVVKGPFRKKYENIPWRNNETEFEAWCAGKTGYPLVDAGMRELNSTGFMHNRVRMVTASFLTKHLLIDWTWGEAYFAQKLLDFDLASNNGGWQWAAGTGTDAAPYFRIFNPMSQQQKFDKNLDYVRKWVPEYGTSAYAAPIVEHKHARERCLAVYKEALN